MSGEYCEYEALRAITAYPLPECVIDAVCRCRGIETPNFLPGEVADAGFGRAYHLAEADLLTWLSLAPNVAQGGQNYSFTDLQRQQMRSRAERLYQQYDPDNAVVKPVYGYKGGSL